MTASTRGGVRPNSGRKKLKVKNVTISISLPPEMAGRLDREAEQADMPRSELIQNIINSYQFI